MGKDTIYIECAYCKQKIGVRDEVFPVRVYDSPIDIAIPHVVACCCIGCAKAFKEEWLDKFYATYKLIDGQKIEPISWAEYIGGKKPEPKPAPKPMPKAAPHGKTATPPHANHTNTTPKKNLVVATQNPGQQHTQKKPPQPKRNVQQGAKPQMTVTRRPVQPQRQPHTPNNVKQYPVQPQRPMQAGKPVQAKQGYPQARQAQQPQRPVQPQRPRQSQQPAQPYVQPPQQRTVNQPSRQQPANYPRRQPVQNQQRPATAAKQPIRNDRHL